MPRHPWRATAAALAAVAALLLYGPADADPSTSEAQLKAAFVLNFARYVEWPDGAFASHDAPVVLCVIGHDALDGALMGLENRQINGRSLKVRTGITTEDVQGCHVAFIAESEARHLASTLHRFANRPTLTVSDVDGFIDSGGAIGIVRGEDRLQFEVNRGALEQVQLKVSSQLLKLARAVVGGDGH